VGTYTNLRSTDVERYTPKFLKNWETQLFQKYLGIRLALDTKAALFGFAEVSASPNFSAGCIFHLHSASVGSRPFRAIQVAHDCAACPIGIKIIAGAAASLLTLTPTTCLWLFSAGAAQQFGSSRAGAWNPSFSFSS